MTHDELQAEKVAGMEHAIMWVEGFTARAMEHKNLSRPDVMDAILRTLQDIPQNPAMPGGKEIFLGGLLAAAIALLAEERGKGK
jgi:hypothetical protein